MANPSMAVDQLLELLLTLKVNSIVLCYKLMPKLTEGVENHTSSRAWHLE